jgi:uncharacterized protein YdhG (YjbR/CyaY superfamily)
METAKPGYQTIQEYIRSCPKEVRGKLKELRSAITAAAPEAEERISYRMPAFWLKGYVVYFAAFKNHIGFFPTATGVRAFKDKLTGYTTSKGTVQFPLDRPLPLTLIRNIVKFKVAENLKNSEAKIARGRS